MSPSPSPSHPGSGPSSTTSNMSDDSSDGSTNASASENGRVVPDSQTKSELKEILAANNLLVDGLKPVLMARLQMFYLGWNDDTDKVDKYFKMPKTALVGECALQGIDAKGTIPELRRRLVLHARNNNRDVGSGE